MPLVEISTISLKELLSVGVLEGICDSVEGVEREGGGERHRLEQNLRQTLLCAVILTYKEKSTVQYAMREIT